MPDKNAYAFPGGLEPWAGMTLRDYFAAHATAEPQEWFVPVVAPFPIHPKLDEYGVTFAQHQPPGGDPVFEGRPEDVERFKTALSEHRNDLEKWRLERQKQCYIQWPYAWADAVLAASEVK